MAPPSSTPADVDRGRRGRTAAWAVAVLLSLAGCGDDPVNTGDAGTTDVTDDGAVGDAAADTEDVAAPDVDDTVDTTPDVATPDVGPADGLFGDPCRTNEECVSGYCVAGPGGFICTERCVDECPTLEGVEFTCRVIANSGGDETLVCQPFADTVCEPCIDDRNCSAGLCVTTESGRVCGLDCEVDDDCPADMLCFDDVEGVPLSRSQCLPFSLTCDCRVADEGATRPCSTSNEAGSRTCLGVATCEPALGWVGCTAPVPTDEVCDGFDNDCNGVPDDGLSLGGDCLIENDIGACPGIEVCGDTGIVCFGQEPVEELCDRADNDCDGDIDETFVDDAGLYLSDEHCGVCGNACADRFPPEWGSACELVDSAPTCVVTSCPDGFAPAGRTSCVPLDSALCQPCSGDDDCNPIVGDRCISYGVDLGFCGRSCAADSPFGTECPTGYACDGDLAQCVRTEGTCVCEPGDTFFLPCTLTDPSGERTCVGRRACDDGTLLSCEPPEEFCDGIDNDCDGDIDEAFTDDDGAYTLDAHCGRCFNDCISLFGPSEHADGVCDAGTCTPLCDAGWRDADGLLFNGCECQPTSETDLPDIAGIDANCDGIDGEVARGVFVSAAGSDITGDGSREAPYGTIQTAIDAAVPGSRDHVYVSAGVYDQSLTLRDGVSLYGGYGFDFGQRDIGGNETAIVGGVPSPVRPGAINARGIVGETVVDGFTVVGYDRAERGESSYAVHLTDCGGRLTLTNNTVRAGAGGAGAPGETGDPGRNAAGSGFAPAEQGQPQVSAGGDCPASPVTTAFGGEGAQFACPAPDGSTALTNGGDGGDAGCPVRDVAATPGAAGVTTPGAATRPSTAGGAGGGGGYALLWNSTGATCNLCAVPTGATQTIEGLFGLDGVRGDDGRAGNGCAASAGIVVDGQWRPGGSGDDGGVGGPGSGGGGGGAGGGVQNQGACVGVELLGGGGGGGGAGGCGGSGGGGGGSGGGSFGIFLVYTASPSTLPTLRDNRIFRGRGGDGGNGGPGGEGGEGSTGAQINESPLGCPGPGGPGGDGGQGGPGGGGGGGCGGPSVAIYVGGIVPGGLPTGSWRSDNLFPDSGAPGAPGRGGPSAGRAGGDGQTALDEQVLPCPDGGAPPCD